MHTNIVETIKAVTGFFEFAARMAYQGVLGPMCIFRVDLHGVDGRELSYMSARRMDDHYWCRSDQVQIERTFNSDTLKTNSRELVCRPT